MIALRNNEGMYLVLVEFGCVITVLFKAAAVSSSYTSQMRLKKRRENVLLIGTGINVGSEQNRRVPEVGLQFFDSYSLTH